MLPIMSGCAAERAAARVARAAAPAAAATPGELDELRGRRLNLDYAGGGGYAEAGQTRLCWGAAEEAAPHRDASQMQKRRRPAGGGGGGKRGRW